MIIVPNCKPVLFNTEMVQAILEDRKDVTRRAIKDKDIINHWDCESDGTPIAYIEPSTGDRYAATFPCPYQVGDILYVRETWSMASDILGGEEGPVYRADYSADEIASLKKKHFRWHPSLHMPKKLARIFLKVTDVRVERLQDITYEECRREGIWDNYKVSSAKYHENLARRAYPKVFSELWDETVSPSSRDRFGWDANPWVWVIPFEKCEKPYWF